MTGLTRVFDSRSEQQTRQLAARLAKNLDAGGCLALTGELGSGKTRFVQGLAMGLGIDPAEVNSPTFVLCHVYRGGRMELHHVDAYRLRHLDEFWELGIHELLDAGALVAIEWSDKVSQALPEDRIEVAIHELSPNERRIEISARGNQDHSAIQALGD